MHIYKINDSMYEMDITLCFNGTKKEMVGYIKNRFGLSTDQSRGDGEFNRLESSEGKIVYVIYIAHFNWKIPEYGILAHEVMHCVHRVLDDLGFWLSNSSVEAYSYYYQKIFQECIFGINEKLKKKKGKKK